MQICDGVVILEEAKSIRGIAKLEMENSKLDWGQCQEYIAPRMKNNSNK